MVEVEVKHSISNPYTIDKKPDTNIPCTSFAEPVVTSTVVQTFVPTEVIKDDRVWIDARPIHAFVRSKQQFVDWIKNRIEEIGAVENRDYLVHKFMKQVFHQGGMRNAEQNDYYVTPSMGQELGMLEKTAEGRSVRLGFIERSERLAKIESAPKPVPVTFDLNNLDPDAMLEALISVQQLRKQEKAKQIELSGNVKQLEEKNTKLVSEVADLHDHLDALGLGAVYDSLFSP